MLRFLKTRWHSLIGAAVMLSALAFCGISAAVDPSLNTLGGGSRGLVTATTASVINALVPPRPGAFTRITAVQYKCAGTAHTLTFFCPLGATTVATAAATGQAVIVVANATPLSTHAAIAANDFCVWDNGDGTYSFDKVASVSTTSITMTSNIPKALAVGQTFWHMGITTDKDPLTGLAYQQLDTPTSAVTTWTDNNAGLYVTAGKFQPILVQSNNATAAGTLEQVLFVHTEK